MAGQGVGTAAETGARFDYARFVSVRRAYGPTVSADGRRVAFVADLPGVPQIYAVGPEGGWPERLTFTQDRIGAVHFAPGDDRMIVASDVGGDECIQLSLLSPHGEAMTTSMGSRTS
jgi:Tol biopolymer transport system component